MNETCSCLGKGSCTFCVSQRKLEKNKDKPVKVQKPLKQTPIVKKPIVKKLIDLDVMKGSVVKPKGSSKRIKSEEELELEKKKKAKDKELAKKERDKKRKVNKRVEKAISITNLQILYQKLVRLITPEYCASCNTLTTSEKGGNQKNAGHCIEKSKSKSTALIMTNMYAQCWNCNNKNIGNGRPVDLYKYGEKFWGKDEMELMHNLSKIPYSFDKGERIELYEYALLKIKEAENLITNREKEMFIKEVYQYQINQQWFINILNQLNKTIK